jgi:hypothetical protein
MPIKPQQFHHNVQSNNEKLTMDFIPPTLRTNRFNNQAP